MSSEQDYVCTLTEASLEKAKKELYEDPTNRMGAVETLRAWIKQQPHLRCKTGTATMYRLHCHPYWLESYIFGLNIYSNDVDVEYSLFV